MSKVSSYTEYSGGLASTDFFYLLRSSEPSGSRDFKFAGSRLQASHANLTALAGLTLAANKLPYATGPSTMALATLTAAGRAILDDADNAEQRATLGFLTATGTLDFAEIAAVGQADLTITVAGAAVGDTVMLGLPAAPTAGIVFNAFVSASNTVTVRATNVTAAPVNPASATYRVTVIH